MCRIPRPSVFFRDSTSTVLTTITGGHSSAGLQIAALNAFIDLLFGQVVAGYNPMWSVLRLLRSRRAGKQPKRTGIAVALPVRAPSVLRRQEECGCAPVRLSDDPDSGAVVQRVCGEKPETASERELVLLAIMLVKVSPVTDGVSAQQINRRLTGFFERGKRSRCSYDLA